MMIRDACHQETLQEDPKQLIHLAKKKNTWKVPKIGVGNSASPTGLKFD